MKTETQLNIDILAITNIIRNEQPELLKFLSEMPITIPIEKAPEINVKILEDYYCSLVNLLKKYAPNHTKLGQF